VCLYIVLFVYILFIVKILDFDGLVFKCTDQVIGCDDVDKRKVGGQEVNVVAVCRSGVLQYK